MCFYGAPMAFMPPTLNTTCNVWRRSTWLATWPLSIATPDLALLPCQLRGLEKPPVISGLSYGPVPLEALIVAKGTDLRAPFRASNEVSLDPDIVEVPSGSSRWYFGLDVVDVAKGFTNEYRLQYLVSTVVSEGTIYSGRVGWPWVPAWPVPYN